MLTLVRRPSDIGEVHLCRDGVVRVRAGRLELGGLDEDRRPPEVDVATGVVGMQVAVDDQVDVVRCQPNRGDGLDDRGAREAHRRLVLGGQMLGQAGVDQHGGVGVPDDPGVDDDSLARCDHSGKRKPPTSIRVTVAWVIGE